MYITVPVPCVLYTIQSVILFPVMTVIVVWDLVEVRAGTKKNNISCNFNFLCYSNTMLDTHFSIVDHLSGECPSSLADTVEKAPVGGGDDGVTHAQSGPTLALPGGRSKCSGQQPLCLLELLREDDEEVVEEEGGITQEEIQLFHSRLPQLNSEREKLRLVSTCRIVA